MSLKQTFFSALILITLFFAYYLYQVSHIPSQTVIYPRSEKTFVGDPMPYYDSENNLFKIYYLEDLRDGQIGFHPISLLETKNFYHYTEYHNIIPFINEENSPERAIGTGTFFKEGDTYHAFYTAHNDNLSPKESIMHATSTDSYRFNKITSDTFNANLVSNKDGVNFNADDFRDPYVFFEPESNKYWMLVTTRKNNKGVIAKLTSNDLARWENEGILFENDLGNDANLECASLVPFNGKWILAFSDQWDQRVVHYRIADSPNGPFNKPNQASDYLDSNGFYAGRLVTNGNELFVTGWIPTKEGHEDRGKYNWAGNLAVHQLTFENDQIKASLPEITRKKIKTSPIPAQKLTEGQRFELNLDKQTKIFEGTFKTDDTSKTVALNFSKNNHIVLDFATNHAFYTYREFGVDTYENAVSSIPISAENNQYQVTIVKENDIVVIYLNGVALSNRLYETDEKIEIVAHEGSIEFQ